MSKGQQAKIRRLWLDEKYRAGFSGAGNFFRALREDAGKLGLKKLTYRQVLDTLDTIPTYVQVVKKKTGYERRGLKFEADETGDAFVASQGQSFHADLGEMPASDAGYRFFLLMVDLWDLYTYVKPLKSKEKAEVLEAIKDIRSENDLHTMDSIGVDKGSEFIYAKDALAKLGVRLYVLQGDHKAFQAERRLRDVKFRVYRAARSKFSNKWELYLQKLVDGINATPTSALRGLTPASVNSPYSDPVVRAARRQTREAKESSSGKKPKKSSTVYKEGDYVYPDLKAMVFDDRAFHLKRLEIYKITKVDRSSEPFLYTLTNESGTKTLDKKFYAYQLRPAPEPFKENTAVERIVEERTVKDDKDPKKKKTKVQALVKWVGYGPESNTWVDVANIVGYKGLAWQDEQDRLLEQKALARLQKKKK